MGVTVLAFAVELQNMRTKCIFERGLGRVSEWNVCERGKKVLKKAVFTEFTSRHPI